MTSALPSKNEEYGTKEYWNRRYEYEAQEHHFDWFKSYDDLAPYIHDLIPDKSSRILMLGCGNSKLPEEMWEDGYKNIVNIDVCDPPQPVQLETKPDSTVQNDKMQWLEMDVRSLKFNDDSFDIVIDKGTMDAMLTYKGDVWNPPEHVVKDCTKEVDEALRVLCKGKGKFLYITFGQPHFRKRFLTRAGTTLEIKELGEAFHYYLYIIRT